MIAVVWKTAKSLMEFEAAQTGRLREDPHKIPEMPTEEFAAMRDRFVAAHPDVMLHDRIEPHKKFIERMSRDVKVHGVVMFYELGEVRIKAERITKTAGFSRSAEKLLAVTETVEPASVDSDEDALHRITAWCFALEYIGVCPYRSMTYVEGATDGCSLSYLARLNEERRSFCDYNKLSPFAFTVLVDRCWRSRMQQAPRLPPRCSPSSKRSWRGARARSAGGRISQGIAITDRHACSTTSVPNAERITSGSRSTPEWQPG